MRNPADPRNLAELVSRQAARQATTYLQLEGREVMAIQKLAVAVFGNEREARGGVIEVLGAMPGVFHVGHFTEPFNPRDPKNLRRRRRIYFMGRTHRELTEQARMWQQAGCPREWALREGV